MTGLVKKGFSPKTKWGLLFALAISWSACMETSPPLLLATVIEAREQTIKRGHSLSWEFQVGELTAGQNLALDLLARASGKDPSAGSPAYLMEIRMNGHLLKAAPDRLHNRLRNKPRTATSGGAWYSERVGWLVPASPDFRPGGQYDAEAFHYVIDVTSLLRKGKNTVLIRNVPHLTQQRLTTLAVRDIQLVSVPPQHNEVGLTVRAGASPELQETADGGITVLGGGYQFPVSSYFSVPGGGWLRVGRAHVPRPAERAAPVVPFVIGRDRGFQVDGGAYILRRTVIIANGRALVRDQFTNRTQQDLGMMVRYELAFPGKVARIHVGGDDDPAILQTHEPANPTLFVPLGGLSLGLIAEDDVLRVQGILSYSETPPQAGIRTERLTIPAGESVSLQWSVYAFSGGDYFDFINRVRRDWQVHLKLEGPYWWNVMAAIGKPDDELSAWLNRTPLYAAVIGSWWDKERNERPPIIGLGVGVMAPAFDSYRTRVRQAVQKIHRLAPGIKVGVYEHMFFNWPEAEAGQFPDSWITLKDGMKYVELWNAIYSPSVGVFPTAANSFGQAFRQALEDQRSALKVDGFYFDETNGPGRLHEPVTFNTWDSHSALLNPKTFAIEHKIGYLSLLSGGYLHGLIHSLRREGMWVLGNNQPWSYRSNRDTWPRFAETDNLKGAFQAHLYSPLAYSHTFETYSVETLRERLDLGLVYCVTGPGDRLGIVGKFFPITPQELHAGWIKGDERIITDNSGSFGWPGERYRARLWRYQADGTVVEPAPAWQDMQGLTAIEVPAGGIAILERHPQQDAASHTGDK